MDSEDVNLDVLTDDFDGCSDDDDGDGDYEFINDGASGISAGSKLFNKIIMVLFWVFILTNSLLFTTFRYNGDGNNFIQMTNLSVFSFY